MGGDAGCSCGFFAGGRVVSGPVLHLNKRFEEAVTELDALYQSSVHCVKISLGGSRDLAQCPTATELKWPNSRILLRVEVAIGDQPLYVWAGTGRLPVLPYPPSTGL